MLKCAAGADGKYKELHDHIFCFSFTEPKECKHWTYIASNDAETMRDSLIDLLDDMLREAEDIFAMCDAMECSLEHGKVHHKRSYAICEAPF